MPLLVEIKARCPQPERIRQLLVDAGADFRGEDHQIDTYFSSPNGRLKLRQGRIENNLIQYERPDQAAPKTSAVSLCPVSPEQRDALRRVLSRALGVAQTVDKRREIYFIDNVKFHIDRVRGLGGFVEIEAIAEAGERNEAELRAQCAHYLGYLSIAEADLITHSYADLLADAN